MMKRSVLLTFVCILFANLSAQVHWNLSDKSNGILLDLPNLKQAYSDHIEMSGEQMSFVLRWNVTEDKAFMAERSLVFPMLRTIPNNTHASLMQRVKTDIPSLISVNGLHLQREQVVDLEIDGSLRVVSTFAVGKANVGLGAGKVMLPTLQMERVIYPSPTKPVMCELYNVKNISAKPITVLVPEFSQNFTTRPEKGVDGSYIIRAEILNPTTKVLQPGEELDFSAVFQAYRSTEQKAVVDPVEELNQRRGFLKNIDENLVLDTPDDVIDREFRFAKIRASESIFKTKGGYMHAPGGESYYAAIWANDQAEYVNPFFPFLGYEVGNESALNSFKMFARFMNDEFKPIPSSIIAEGTDIWNGAGDRGDAAMIAYGASRYVLAKGDKEAAKELWPLIEWCLEYCKKNLNEEGVVLSNTDELEGRFPAGEANLCTSSLYYDALLSASYICKELGIGGGKSDTYLKQAKTLAANIDKYFAAEMCGFDTYRYYKGNTKLRSWICMPLIVDIFDRASGTIEALTSPHLLMNDGLLTEQGSATFWDRSTLYALRGIFRAGKSDVAYDFLKHYSERRLLGEHVPYPIEAYPEGSQRHLSAESGLYCRVITEGMFGIRPTGFASFNITPNMPKAWDNMALRNVRAFGSNFDVVVTRVSGKKMKMEIRLLNNNKKITRVFNEGQTVKIKF